jgi:hypothetical protein
MAVWEIARIAEIAKIGSLKIKGNSNQQKLSPRRHGGTEKIN